MIRNAAKITVTNKTLCVKVLLVRLICYAICFTICFFLAKATIFPIFKSEEVSQIFNTLRGIVGNFFNSNPEIYDTIINTVHTELADNVSAFLTLLNSKVSGIVWSIVGVILVCLILTFLFGIFDYTVGVLINEHMSSLQHAGFFTTLFENFVSACKYGLYRLVALLCYNAIAYSIVGVLSILLIYLIDFFALPLIVLMGVIIVVIRQTYAGQTLPNMICGKMTVMQAFKENFKEITGSRVLERFISYLVLGIIMFSVTVLGIISTFYVSLIITVPFSAVVYSAVKFVDYYGRKGLRYYITFDDIVTPKELRENDEQLLNKVDLF